jgi:two-component system nitrate/nitrite response regulator NarL
VRAASDWSGQMRESLGIVLADRQSLFIDALRAAMTSRGHHVLAATTTCHHLLAEVRRLEPDLCVIDSTFPDGDGIDAIGEITTASPLTKVVVLTADAREATMRRALDAGAGGFLHKSRGLAAVLRVLEKVVGGEVCVLMAAPAQRGDTSCSAHQMRQLAAFLTPREIECLGLLAAGLDTLQIARRLGVSSATVRSHVQSLMTKLGVHTRLEAVTLAIRHELIRGAGERYERHERVDGTLAGRRSTWSA